MNMLDKMVTTNSIAYLRFRRYSRSLVVPLLLTPCMLSGLPKLKSTCGQNSWQGMEAMQLRQAGGIGTIYTSI